MRQAFAAAVLLLFAATLSAATFDLPSDAELLARADAVVVASVLDSASREAADRMVFTDYRLRVEQVLKGHAAETIVVSEGGGFANGHGVVVAGAPKYEKGTRVLTFLRQRGDGTYFTAYMALGKYRFDKDLLVRDAHGIETMSGEPSDARDAAAFMEAIRTGDFKDARRVTTLASRDPKPATNAAASAYVVLSEPAPEVRPLRWKNGGTIGFTINQVHPADTTLALNHAFNAWNGHTNSSVVLFAAGTFGDDTGRTNDDEHDIVFDWNGSNPHPVCEGSLGCGIVYYNGFGETHVLRGETFYDIVSADVLIHQSVTSQTLFEGVLMHELGHALGFRHSDQGSPSGSGIMQSSIPAALGATRGAWVDEALTAVYGPGLPCVNVSNLSVSGGGLYPFGNTATLSVSASGDTPFTYQWYEGTTGNTTTLVGTNQNFTTPPITTAKQYWVRVSNACPSSANSATLTVEPQPCDVPVITSEPVSQNINSGATAQLHVAGNGTLPFTYQWYRANTVGDTSVPVGTNSQNFTTPPLTTTTSYWVRVSNACGSDDSALATITVGTPCVVPTITQQPSTITLALGQGATLGVTATGTTPFTYQWYEGDSGDLTKPIANATNSTYAAGPYNTAGTFKLWVKVTNACGSKNSNTIAINVACPAIVVPELSAPAVTNYATSYVVSWTGTLAVTPSFELQESTTDDFSANVTIFNVSNALSRTIAAHSNVVIETRFYYRVRAISACTGQTSAWSATASTVVTPPLPADSTTFAVSVPVGTTQPFTQDLLVPGFGDTATANDTFSISIDVPWMTVFPPAGALSAGGTTVQLTINPTGLEVGSLTAAVTITRTSGAPATKIGTHASNTTTTLPFSMSLVTPVTPDPRDAGPPPGTLIIPAVAHAQGIGSPFRSDVRIANVSFDDIEYEITYTQSENDGTQSGKKTTLIIRAGDVIAFDDIVKAWYGAGVLGEGGLGTIEIRPLNGANPAATFASSRTYALDAGGTLGQFIPALRMDQFVGPIAIDSLGRISLQQVANSPDYRTNLGFIEGSGQPVTFLAKLLDGSNRVLQQVSRDLPPFGHLQRNLTALFGEVSLPDGRVEVEVTSPGGKVSAYASVVNNRTNDPLLVFPVQPARTTSPRYVLAGIAEIVAADRNFHSDMRVYNAGNTPVTVTLWYYDRGQSTPHPNAPPRQITLALGEVRAINDVLPTLWPGLIGGGSVIATAPPDSSLVVTAQTYSRQPDGGTKGQFIPGVTFREAVGFGDRAIEVLQLEQSPVYRSNVGIVEVTGAPADVEITMYEPDSKLSAVVPYNLKANEYIQFDRILEVLGQLGTVYNGRVSVKVIGGAGRVYAYGSTVDNRTEDPTYVPGQM